MNRKKYLIRRLVRPLGGFFLLTVGILIANVYYDFSPLLSTLAGTNRRMIGFAGLVYLTSLYVRGYRYRSILSHLGYKFNVWYLTAIVCISQSTNHFVPARGGDVVRVTLIRLRNEFSYSSGLASVTIDRILDMFAITILSMAILVVFFVIQTASLTELFEIINNGDRPGVSVGLTISVVIGIVTLVGVGVLFLVQQLNLSRFGSLLGPFPEDSLNQKIFQSFEKYVIDVQKIGGDPLVFAHLGALSLLLWMIQTLVALMVLFSFSISTSIPVLLAVGIFAISVANLAKAVPITPGGVGIYEGSFAIIVINFSNISWEIALSAAILDHALKNLLTIGVGVVSVVTLRIPIGSILRQSKGE